MASAVSKKLVCVCLTRCHPLVMCMCCETVLCESGVSVCGRVYCVCVCVCECVCMCSVCECVSVCVCV